MDELAHRVAETMLCQAVGADGKTAHQRRIAELEAALRKIIEHSKMQPHDWLFASIKEAEKIVQ